MSPEENHSECKSLLPDPLGAHSYPVLDLQFEGMDSYAYLRAHWKVLSKRRWTILIAAFLVASLVALYTYKQKSVYRATAEVEVDSETPDVQSVNNLFTTVPTDATFLQTQVDVLNSGSLAWQTIQQLKLDRNRAFNPAASGHFDKARDTSSTQRPRLIKLFKDSLSVDLVTGSRMIRVSFESSDPQLAAEVANTLVANYREYNFRSKYDATRQASGWMSEQLNELRARVEKSQEALVDYERRSSIVNINGKENVEDQRLADLSQDLTMAQNDLAQQESLYHLVKANPEKAGLLAQDSLLQDMEEKSADLKTAYIDALGQYGPKFPKVARLHDQIGEIQSLISQEQARTVERITHNYNVALGRLKLLTDSVAREKSEVGKLSQLMIQYDLLKHDFDTNQQLYDSLLTRVKEAAVSTGLRANNVHLVDHALVPSIPVMPRKGRNIAIGLMVGLILGTTMAFIREVMDTSIMTAEDIERSIAEPVLGVIPAVHPGGIGKSWFSRHKKKPPPAFEGVEWAVLRQPTSMLAESYHSLRTAVLLSSEPRPPRALLLTSAQPFEGKTATAFNLAVALTQIGRHVLFIDADMRQPGLKRILDTNGRPGLSNILASEVNIEQAIFQMPQLPDLWFLSAGPQPSNPADLLAYSAMKELLATLRVRFDHIVVDTPPALMVTDATVVSSFVDGVILVTESEVTARAALVRTHRVLENAGANILGCVLNKLDLKYDGHYGSNYCNYVRYYSQSRNGKRLPLTRAVVEPIQSPRAEET
jgi:succinoglycan biosynthesis transport protein ExoP